MKIASITTNIIKIPLKTPFTTALRSVENVEFARVKVECANGVFAYGEAPATKAITGEGLEDILNSVHKVKEEFIGICPKEALTLLHKLKIGSSAKASLDIAFVSLLAKEREERLYEYFNASDISPLQTDVTISLGEEEKMLSDSIEAYNRGLRILKIKVGSDIEHAIRVIKSISAKLPKASLLIDANQAWSMEESIEFINSIKDVKVELIEQPLNAKELESLKELTKLSHIPILADESVFTLEEVKEIVQNQRANMINIKLMKCGGLSKAVEILEYARENGVVCMIGSMLEGPYSINATIHLALAYRDVIQYVDLDSPLLYKEMPNELDFVYKGDKITLK